MSPRHHPQLESSGFEQLDDWRAALLVGIDEAGRGPLAGPVCAAAVALPVGFDPALGRDSKTLSEAARERLAERIQGEARGWCLGWASVSEIDERNILAATEQAMLRALDGLLATVPGAPAAVVGTSARNHGSEQPARVLVDGNRLPPIGQRCAEAYAVVKGDARVAEIGAASILAKVARDQLMRSYDSDYPGYDFGTHKGYGTARHRAALAALGPSPIHRRSFAPVRALCP